MILLSDVDGLYDRDPSDAGARRIPSVDRIDEATGRLVVDRTTGLSKGGMASKLEAARIATASGESVIIANGHQPGVMAAVLAGKDVGTLFTPNGQSVSLRKRWIGFAMQVAGELAVDEGAQRAVLQQGRSLLAIGVRGAKGEFAKGDAVSICGPDGREFARGMSNYSADEIARIQGLKAAQIAEVLGHCPYDEVVHRDNLSIAQ